MKGEKYQRNVRKRKLVTRRSAVSFFFIKVDCGGKKKKPINVWSREV